MKRKPKRFDATELREKVTAFCRARGGVAESETAYNSVLEGVIGGDFVLSTRAGKWIVHLPSDGFCLFSINTRFEDPERAAAVVGRYGLNPFSGKWNHNDTCADGLFETFELCAARLFEACLSG